MWRRTHWAKGNRELTILAMALAILAFSRGTLEAQNTTVMGVVKDASGEPVAGALIKVGSAESGLTFLVVSQAQGRYATPNLLPGKYTVQGFGGGYQSERAGPVEVRSGQQDKVDVALTAQRVIPLEKRMMQADYAKLMPEDDAKKLFISRCQICHGLERIVPRRAGRPEWLKSINEMRFYLQERRVPLSEQERDVMVDYAVKHFGPDTPPLRPPAGSTDPDRHLPVELLKGAEAKYVAMELDLQKVAGAFDIAVDSQGIAWVSEEKRGAGMLGRFDPKSLAYTRIALPPGKFPRELGAIAVDPRDQVWLADNGPNAQWFQYDSKSKTFNTYEIPVPAGLKHPTDTNTLRFHPDGSVWGTGITSGRLMKLDPNTRKVAEYPIPHGSRPYGMAIGGDQMIWYVGDYGNALVRLDPGTGKLTPYKALTPRSDLRRMGADAEGNLWAGQLETGKLMKVDYRTGKVTEYTPPTPDAGLQDVAVDTKRNLIWFNERNADKIGRYDPRANTFAEFPQPNADNDGRRIRVDPTNPNRVWWDARIGRIGYVEVLE